MNRYSDLGLDNILEDEYLERESYPPPPQGLPPWRTITEALQFLAAFHAMVVTGLSEMRRIQRDLVTQGHRPSLEYREKFKADQEYLNETFIRLRECLKEFMNSGRGIRLPQ